jgi:hypothetical protein
MDRCGGHANYHLHLDPKCDYDRSLNVCVSLHMFLYIFLHMYPYICSYTYFFICALICDTPTATCIWTSLNPKP